MTGNTEMQMISFGCLTDAMVHSLLMLPMHLCSLHSTLGGFTNTLQRSTHGTGKHCKGVIHPVDSSFFCSTHSAVVHIQQSIVPRKLYKHAPHVLTTQWQELAPPPCSLSHGQTRRAGRGGRATQMFSLSNQQPAAHMFSSTPS